MLSRIISISRNAHRFATIFVLSATLAFPNFVMTTTWAQATNDPPVVLNGPFISADFVRHDAPKKAELFACDEEGVVKVFDLAGKVSRQWQVGGGLRQVLRFKASSRADAYVAMGAEGELVFGSLSAPGKVRRGNGLAIYNRFLFSQDGTWLAAFDVGGVQVWRTVDWSECSMIHDTAKERGDQTVLLAFIKNGDGDFFATTGFPTPVIKTWSLPNGERSREFSGDEDLDSHFMDIATSPDSRWIVGVGTWSDRLVVWDINSGKVVARPKAFKTGVGNRLTFSGDGKFLVCTKALHGSMSRTGFRVYRVSGWEELHHFVVSDDVPQGEWEKLEIEDITVDSTGSNAATLHDDGRIRLWTIPSKPKKAGE